MHACPVHGANCASYAAPTPSLLAPESGLPCHHRAPRCHRAGTGQTVHQRLRTGDLRLREPRPDGTGGDRGVRSGQDGSAVAGFGQARTSRRRPRQSRGANCRHCRRPSPGNHRAITVKKLLMPAFRSRQGIDLSPLAPPLLPSGPLGHIWGYDDPALALILSEFPYHWRRECPKQACGTRSVNSVNRLSQQTKKGNK